MDQATLRAVNLSKSDSTPESGWYGFADLLSIACDLFIPDIPELFLKLFWSILECLL